MKSLLEIAKKDVHAQFTEPEARSLAEDIFAREMILCFLFGSISLAIFLLFDITTEEWRLFVVLDSVPFLICCFVAGYRAMKIPAMLQVDLRKGRLYSEEQRKKDMSKANRIIFCGISVYLMCTAPLVWMTLQ